MVELGRLGPALSGDVIERLADRRAIGRERHVRAVRQGHEADLIAGRERSRKLPAARAASRPPPGGMPSRSKTNSTSRPPLRVSFEAERLGSAGARCRRTRGRRGRRFALAQELGGHDAARLAIHFQREVRMCEPRDDIALVARDRHVDHDDVGGRLEHRLCRLRGRRLSRRRRRLGVRYRDEERHREQAGKPARRAASCERLLLLRARRAIALPVPDAVSLVGQVNRDLPPCPVALVVRRGVR